MHILEITSVNNVVDDILKCLTTHLLICKAVKSVHKFHFLIKFFHKTFFNNQFNISIISVNLNAFNELKFRLILFT